MRKYLLFFICLIFSSYNYLHGHTGFKIEIDTLTIKKYGLTFNNGVVLDYVYEFVYPVNNTPEISRIRDLITQDFFLNDSIIPLDDAINRYEKGILNDYASQMENTTHQYYTQYSAIKIINNKVLVFMVQSYFHLGGIHGLEPSGFTNYDLRTGDKITLDNLFPEKSKSAIIELIKQKIATPLSSEVWLTDNFIILSKGIRFSFNPNQIAYYGAGRIDAILKLSEFKHLLKPEAIYYFHKDI